MSVDPKAKLSAFSHLNISWVQHIDVLHITQVEIASGRRPRWTRTSQNSVPVNFSELRKGEVRAEGRAGQAGHRSDRGNRTGGYSSTNSSKGTPYALAIFVTVGM